MFVKKSILILRLISWLVGIVCASILQSCTFYIKPRGRRVIKQDNNTISRQYIFKIYSYLVHLYRQCGVELFYSATIHWTEEHDAIWPT